MPPKKGAGPNMKKVQAVHAKLVEDKTFGLKNKNKSKKVQKFVQTVEKQTRGGAQILEKQAEAAQRKEVKTQAAEAKKQMDALMLGDGNARIEERKRKDDAKRKLAEKQALKDAGLSSDSEDDDEDDGPVYKPDWWEDGMSLEEEVEAERKALPPGGTMVTVETFAAWKIEKEKKQLKTRTKMSKLAEMDAKSSGKVRGVGGGGKFLNKGVLTGKDLFSLHSELFKDAEDGAAAEKNDYDHESEEGSGDEDEDADYGFPSHWGEPPMVQASDKKELPGGYGTANSTLAKWVQKKMDADEKKGVDSAKNAAVQDAPEVEVMSSPTAKGKGKEKASIEAGMAAMSMAGAGAGAGAVNSSLFMDDLGDLDDLDDL